MKVFFKEMQTLIHAKLNYSLYQLDLEAGNNTSAFNNLPLADYPMVIVEKEELDFN